MDKLSNNSSLLLVLLLIIEALLSFYPISTIACIEEEREALLKLKESFIDPSNRLASWKGIDCCNWEGVGCNRTSGHVIKLDLQNHQDNFSTALLANWVDSSLLELKHLSYLDFSRNYFNYTQIPNFFGSMQELRYLNLSHACFYWWVPRHLGNLTSLLTLDLNNFYSSSVSNILFIDDAAWISGLSSLRYLDLSGVNLEEALNLMEVLNTLPSLLSLRLMYCDLQKIHLFHPSFNSSFLPGLQLLDMSQNAFNCAIPDTFQNMTSLRFLYFSNNGFNSSIPSWLGNLKNLVELSLKSNLFTKIETGFSSIIRNNCHLKVFDLSNNPVLHDDVFGSHENFSIACKEYDLEVLNLANSRFGAYKIPRWIGHLKHLKFLDLSYNLIFGPIPTMLGNLSSIEYLNISYNMLSGGIPSSFGNLLNLKELRLGVNNLDGVIAESFGQLQSLELLDIAVNSLKGVVSEIHFTNLSRLHSIWMGFNALSFDMKSNWVPPVQLNFFSMRSCKGFGTEFPLWFQTQKKLKFLDLSNTSISGALPTWLRGENLSALDLSYNHITGSLPESIGDQMPNLSMLLLVGNHINASIPQSLCKLKNLQVLDLSNNRLTGAIPSCLLTSVLVVMSLLSNNFSGVFPNPSKNLSRLQQLYLANNSFDGELPIGLRSGKSLAVLDLDGNQFSGIIPTWIGENLKNLQILKLGHNLFNATIPSSLCLLPYLQILDLSHNKLVGNIPSNPNNFTAMRLGMGKPLGIFFCVGDGFNSICYKRYVPVDFKSQVSYYTSIQLSLMVNIDLSSNNLVGSIPSEITTLKFLGGLNLSHNNLTAAIPGEIGKMEQLESLDLSFNQLCGSLPDSMSQLHALGVLKLSNNNFSGRIPREGHLLTFNDVSTYDGNPYLCGDPLPVRCLNEKPFEPPIDTDNHENRNGQEEDKWEKTWFCNIAMVGYAFGFWGVVGSLILKKRWRYAYFQFVDEAKDKIHVAILVKMKRLKGERRQQS